MLVLGITVPVATFLSRRFSVRQHVFIALAFFLVGALADLFAPNFGVLLTGRVFQAISTGMLMPLMQTIAMTRFPRGRQATACLLYTSRTCRRMPSTWARDTRR